jgi:hypothetical protein
MSTTSGTASPYASVELAHAVRAQAAATLASAIIAAAGRAHSVEQAMDVYQSCLFAMFPQPNQGSYRAWKESDKASRVHS